MGQAEGGSCIIPPACTNQCVGFNCQGPPSNTPLPGQTQSCEACMTAQMGGSSDSGNTTTSLPVPEPVALVQPEPVALVQPEPVALVQPEPVALVQPEPVALEPAPVQQEQTGGGVYTPAPAALEPAPVLPTQQEQTGGGVYTPAPAAPTPAPVLPQACTDCDGCSTTGNNAQKQRFIKFKSDRTNWKGGGKRGLEDDDCKDLNDDKMPSSYRGKMKDDSTGDKADFIDYWLKAIEDENATVDYDGNAGKKHRFVPPRKLNLISFGKCGGDSATPKKACSPAAWNRNVERVYVEKPETDEFETFETGQDGVEAVLKSDGRLYFTRNASAFKQGGSNSGTSSGDPNSTSSVGGSCTQCGTEAPTWSTKNSGGQTCCLCMLETDENFNGCTCDGNNNDGNICQGTGGEPQLDGDGPPQQPGMRRLQVSCFPTACNTQCSGFNCQGPPSTASTDCQTCMAQNTDSQDGIDSTNSSNSTFGGGSTTDPGGDTCASPIEDVCQGDVCEISYEDVENACNTTSCASSTTVALTAQCTCSGQTCDAGNYCYLNNCHNSAQTTMTSCAESTTVALTAQCKCNGLSCDAGKYCYNNNCHNSAQSIDSCTNGMVPGGTTCKCGNTDVHYGSRCVDGTYTPPCENAGDDTMCMCGGFDADGASSYVQCKKKLYCNMNECSDKHSTCDNKDGASLTKTTFDCSGETNAIAAAPATITCTGSACTADECCTGAADQPPVVLYTNATGTFVKATCSEIEQAYEEKGCAGDCSS